MADEKNKNEITAEKTDENPAETTKAEAKKEPVSKNAGSVKKKKMVKIRLPRLEGQGAPTEEFFSVNFKNYIIKRGVDVEVPEDVAEVIMNAEKAKDSAIDYAEKHKLREAGKDD